MRTIKNFDDFLKENYSEKELNIINDILSTNESFDDWINKLIKYGKKGLLTASIILSVAFSAQSQNSNKTQDVIKQGTELVTDNIKNDVYSFMVGLSKENMSLSMQNGDIDSAGAFKELSKYYQDLRDNIEPLKLSDLAKKSLKVLTSMKEKLDNETITHFIKVGKTIKNID